MAVERGRNGGDSVKHDDHDGRAHVNVRFVSKIFDAGMTNSVTIDDC